MGPLFVYKWGVWYAWEMEWITATFSKNQLKHLKWATWQVQELNRYKELTAKRQTADSPR